MTNLFKPEHAATVKDIIYFTYEGNFWSKNRFVINERKLYFSK